MDFDHILDNDKIMLERRFSEEEVWNVISSMKGDQVPGPDGFSLSFFKNVETLLKEI